MFPHTLTWVKNVLSKQFHIVQYLDCYLAEYMETDLSEDSIAKKSLKKISTRIQFLYKQRFEFLNPKLHRLLCSWLQGRLSLSSFRGR